MHRDCYTNTNGHGMEHSDVSTRKGIFCIFLINNFRQVKRRGMPFLAHPENIDPRPFSDPPAFFSAPYWFNQFCNTSTL